MFLFIFFSLFRISLFFESIQRTLPLDFPPLNFWYSSFRSFHFPKQLHHINVPSRNRKRAFFKELRNRKMASIGKPLAISF